MARPKDNAIVAGAAKVVAELPFSDGSTALEIKGFWMREDGILDSTLRIMPFIPDEWRGTSAPEPFVRGVRGMIFGAVTVVVLGLFFSRVATAGFSMCKLEVYLGLLLLVGIVLAVEITIQRIWPDGGRRHRALGRFTMIIYCILFATGTFTYTMLYILYPGKIG